LDTLVAKRRYESRSDAVRAALDLLFREERKREIEEEYRRAYAQFPQAEWVGEVGLQLFAAFIEAEEQGQEPL